MSTEAPRRILVADDDPDQRSLMSEYLELFDYDVTQAVNGKEAVDLATENPPDLILMDVRMPVMDGNEATRILKSNPSTRNIPIIILTTGARDVDRTAAFASGCDDYEIKPVDGDQLIAKIEARFAAQREESAGGAS